MKALVQSIVRQALRQMVGIQEVVTYQSIVSASYDPNTGESTTTTTSASLPCVFGNYTLYEKNLSEGSIEKNDRKALILPSDLGAIVPLIGDTMTRGNGEIWEIVEGGIGLDPAEALYLLQVRLTNG